MTHRLRAFTLAEQILTIGLSVTVLGAVLSIYLFVTVGASKNLARHTSLYSITRPLDEIDAVVSRSVSCALVPLGDQDALRCTLPELGTDFNRDGLIDDPLPNGPNKVGRIYYKRGKRVWFYLGDMDGNPTASGGYLFRAIRTNDSDPTPANIDTNWSFDRVSGRPNYPISGELYFLIAASEPLVTTVVSPSPRGESADSLRAPFAAIHRKSVWRFQY